MSDFDRLDPSLLQNAEAAVRQLATEYIGWVSADIARLEAAFAAHLAQGESAEAPLKELYAAAHDMKGQGSTFGYPLITEIAGLLCKYLAANQKSKQILTAHIEALKAVVNTRMAGDGGEFGRRLAAGLERAVSQALAQE